jgi:hypothetical protein
MKRRIAHDLRNDNTNGVLDMVLNAYNRFQEDERDGVDYIFDITKQNDLKCMVDGGLNVTEISWAWNKIKKEGISSCFHFGCNYGGLEAIGTLADLKRNLIAWLDEFLPYVLMYVTRCDEYQLIYEHYITEYLESKDFGK